MPIVVPIVMSANGRINGHGGDIAAMTRKTLNGRGAFESLPCGVALPYFAQIPDVVGGLQAIVAMPPLARRVTWKSKVPLTSIH